MATLIVNEEEKKKRFNVADVDIGELISRLKIIKNTGNKEVMVLSIESIIDELGEAIGKI